MVEAPAQQFAGNESPLAVTAPGVTVAICTRDRPEQLRRALASIQGHADPAPELLVVDNVPPDDRARVVAAAFPARYVVEMEPGLDFARNRALREASQPVVAFLDDDAVAEAGWADALARAFADPRVGAATSRVGALSLESEGQRLFEANGGFSRGDVQIRLPADADRRRLHRRKAPLVAWAVSVGAGCGLAVRRDAALALGGFDEALDRGAALPGGGDHDMLWRMLQAGWDVLYEPSARVLHEHRRERSAAEAQVVGHQRALIALLTKIVVQARGRRRLEAAAFLAWRLFKPGVRLARSLAGRDVLPPGVLLRMWAACWRGLGSYAGARKAVSRTSARGRVPAPAAQR